MTFYICQRNGQCKKPCSENCLYTSEWKKSRLFHADVKPESVELIQDVNGRWWEVDRNWDKNLPKSMRKKPERIINIPYEYITQIELRRLMTRSKLTS